MRRPTKASSAGSTSGQASRLGSFFGAFAVRDGSLRVDGSGAPSIGRTRLALAALLTAALAAATYLALAIGPAPASAAIVHPFLFSFDGSGTPASSFGPWGVAVDNSTSAAAGKVYVNDDSHAVVDRFSSAGSYDCQITGHGLASGTTVSLSECDSATAGTPSGSFGRINTQPAVDPSTGDLYVPDSSGRVIDKFGPDGSYLGRVTVPSSGIPRAVAIDSSGDLFVADSRNKVVRKYHPSTSTWSTFATGTPFGAFGFQLSSVAVDLDSSSPSFGDVYVADSYPNQVVNVFSSSGTFLRRLTDTPTGAFGNALSVAVDPTSGELYVAEANGSHVVDEFSATGAFEGQIQVPAGGSASGSYPAAVAIDAATGDVYVADSNNQVVDVFGPNEILPDVTTGSASGVATTSATLNGHVDPAGDGDVTSCQFEYGTDTSYSDPPVACRDASNAIVGTPANPITAATDVQADLTGLTPGTTYHFRLEASNANGTSYGADARFSTPPPPSITGAEATNLSSNSADLNAQINPEGNDTTYHFEWGTSTSYGTNVPVPDADIGSGTSDVAITQHLTGLSANTEYHWRIVATNIAGPTTTPDHTFIYDTAGGGLPDNRAYEMVTPVQKNGAQIDVGVFMSVPKLSEDGNRVAAASIQCLPGATSCTADRGSEGAVFALTRTPAGWLTTQLSPPAAEFTANSPMDFSADDGTALFSAAVAPGDKDELLGTRADGSLSVLGPVESPSSADAGPPYGALMTADLSHAVFWGSSNQFDWPFDTTVRSGVSKTLLEYVGTGNSEPILVGVSGGPGSTDLVSQCATQPGAYQGETGFMSADGRTIFFTATGHDIDGCPTDATAPPADELLARIDESRTVLLSGRSPADCTSSACQSSAAADAGFESASEDGSKALFSSTQQLTDAATQGSRNLYLYDFAQPAGLELADLSAGDSSGTGPDVRGVMALSSDGTHAYFAAGGVLTTDPNARGETATAGADNLYVYERDSSHPAGRLSFIATLPASDANSWQQAGAKANVTPDGRFLVLPSHGRLTADDSSASGAAQVFRYDAQSGELLRMSIGERGFNDNGNAGSASLCAGQVLDCTAEASVASLPVYGSVRRDPTMSHDGSYVFFASPAGLTPQAPDYVPTGTAPLTGDTTYAQNVYEYHDGHVYLISGGRGTSFGPLLGTDASGANVFFKTSDPLVPQDTDGGQLDIYDARICTTGDPCIKPPPSPPPCEGDECQGDASPSPSDPSSGSSTFAGPGNATENIRSVISGLRKLSSHDRSTLAKGGKARLRLKVNGSGTVTVTGTAKIGKKKRRVVSASAKAKKAGAVTVRFALSRRARAELRRKRSLTVRLTVRFKDARPKVVRFTLKSATSMKGGRS